MHTSAVLLPLLLALPAAQAASRHGAHGAHHGAKRHPAAHNVPDLDKMRREATVAMERHEGLVARAPQPNPAHPLAGGKKGKRLVRKKRDTGCQQRYGVNATASASANATSPATATAALNVTASANATSAANATDSSDAASASANSTAVIGDAAWAGGKTHTKSATASSTSTDSWATATATSTTGWDSATTTDSWAASSSSSSTASSSSSAAAASSTSAWSLVETISGSNFFDSQYWSFWSYSDPTHGTVQFVDSSDAWADGLVSINSNGRAVMAVDTTETVSTGRKAVRIHNNRVWTGGMVLMDAYHMPTGCGTWPAWWQNGPNWPEGGEIDILEGVNAFTQNQVSLHTGVGCTMPSDLNSNQLGTLTTGSYNSYDCSSTDTSNQGCGVRDMSSDSSYGTAFNSVNGGVYAMVWDTAGINVWWFQRSKIPSDITNESPDPSGWGTPVASFPSTDCSPYEFFYDHFNIFDTTLCGDWAGADGVWNYAGYAGQDQSCASITGYSTCSDYVLNSGSSFSEAYWEVSYVKYFNSTSLV